MKNFWLRQTNKQRQKTIRFINYASICIIVTLLTLSIGFTIARMITSAGKSGGTTVAGFVVVTEVKSSTDKMTIDCAKENSASYEFSVSNTKDNRTAEVNIKYEIVVAVPQELPDGVALCLYYGSDEIAGTLSSDKKTYTFAVAQRFAAGQSSEYDYTLTFTADSDKVLDPIAVNGIKVSVNAEQTL